MFKKTLQFTLNTLEKVLTAYVEIIKAIAELAGGLLKALIILCGLTFPLFVGLPLLISMFV